MCSQMDDPTQHDKVTRPRVYELSGTPRGSVALAVLGEMLNEAEEGAVRRAYDSRAEERLRALREARERIADAEQLSRVGYLR